MYIDFFTHCDDVILIQIYSPFRCLGFWLIFSLLFQSLSGYVFYCKITIIGIHLKNGKFEKTWLVIGHECLQIFWIDEQLHNQRKPRVLGTYYSIKTISLNSHNLFIKILILHFESCYCIPSFSKVEHYVSCNHVQQSFI